MSTIPSSLCAGGCGRPESGEHAPLDERCWYLLAGMCLGKKRFRRMRHAELAVQTLPGEWVAYPCRVCGHPHIGGSEEPEQTAKSRRTLVSHLRRTGRGWLLTKLAGEFEGMDRGKWKRRG